MHSENIVVVMTIISIRIQAFK